MLPQGGIGDDLGWLAFMAGSLAMALLVWRRRDPRAASLTGGWLTAMLPALILGGLLAGAWWDGRGSRLAASIERFSIPLGAAPEDASEVLLFRIADRVAEGDLVVQPYLQDHLNRITLADPPRHLVEIHARRQDAGSQALVARVVVSDAPGDAEDERPAMRVRVGEGDLAANPLAPRQFVMAPGSTMRIRIYRQDLSLDETEDEPGLQARRSLTIVNRAPVAGQPGMLEVVPDQPLLSDGGTCRAPRDVLVAAPLEGSPRAGYLQPRNLEFAGLGLGGHDRAVMNQGSAGPLADGPLVCGSEPERIVWPVGAGTDRTSLLVEYTAVGLPWFLLTLFVAASAICHLVTRPASGAERLLVPLLLYLLAVRTMVAIAGAFYDPQEAPAGFYADAASAIVFLPPLLVAAIRPARQGDADDVPWAMWLAATVGLGLAAWLWLPVFSPSAGELVIPAMAVGLLAARALNGGTNPVGEVARRAADWLARDRGELGLVSTWQRAFARGRPGKVVTWLLGLLRPLADNPMLRNAIALLVLIALLRCALWLIGTATGLPLKERVGPLPLSLPYLLALLYGAAMAVAAIARTEGSRIPGAVWLAGGLLATLGALGLVRDNGFILVHLLPICAVAALHLGQSDQGRRRHSLAAAAIVLAPAGLVFAVLAWMAWDASGSLAQLESWQGQAAHLGERMALALEIDANTLRLVQLFAPQAVELVGTRAAYEQMSQTALMHALGSSITGNGWLAPVELLSIRREQTWDYVSAVHLMYPFGRLGVVAFLAVIAAAAGGVLGVPRDDGEPFPNSTASQAMADAVAVLVGRMAACTLIFSAAYLVLGNLLLVPFTGRSIYLISVLSSGEMLEGVLLLGLMALAYGGGRR